MKTILMICAGLLLLPTARVAVGAEADDAAAEIAPFVNEQTIGAARLDLARVNFDALDPWAERVLAQSGLDKGDREAVMGQLKKAEAGARQWSGQFTKAGGKAIWMVFTFEGVPAHPPVFVVVPLARGADAGALRKLFVNMANPNANPTLEAHNAVVAVPGMVDADVIRNLKPQPRPELSQALSAGGDGVLRLALIPSADARRVIESMAPPLPGNPSPAALTRGLVWAGASIQAPPDVAGRIVIQSQDAQSADALLKLVTANAPPDARDKAGFPNPSRAAFALAAALANRARIDGDQIRIDLAPAQALRVAGDLGELLRGAREDAARKISASRVRQLLFGCVLYANEHKGQLPQDLEMAAKACQVGPEVLMSPRHPDQKPGYAYVKPPEVTSLQDIARPSERVLVYETFDRFDGGTNVGFADGHVEWVSSEPEFHKMLDAAEHPKKANEDK